MKWTPRPYQGLLVQHMLDNRRCAGFAGMGMGKTVSTLTALDALFLSGEETRPALVVAPLRVAKFTWPEEAKKWDHLRSIEVVPIVGDPAQRKAAMRKSASVYSINYESVPWLVDTLDGRWPFGTVIADESTKLKGFRLRQGTQRARELGRVAHKHCTRWVNLTGTPCPNGLADLWGQTWFLDAGLRLGRSFDAFRRRWFQQSFDGFGMEPLPHAQTEIQDRIRDLCLTLDPRDWFDLKEPIKNVIRVELPNKARQLYRDMERHFFAEIDGDEIEAVNAAAKSSKCLQIASGNMWTDASAGEWADIHDAKIDALESVIDEAAGAPVLTRYHWVPSKEKILKAFGSRVRDLGTDEGLSDAKAGKGQVWLAHSDSVGHGVDGLQNHCNTICEYDLWWDLEQELQLNERVGDVRQQQAGHDRPVFIHYIVAGGTVDELVLERLESKREVQDILMDAMKKRA